MTLQSSTPALPSSAGTGRRPGNPAAILSDDLTEAELDDILRERRATINKKFQEDSKGPTTFMRKAPFAIEYVTVAEREAAANAERQRQQLLQQQQQQQQQQLQLQQQQQKQQLRRGVRRSDEDVASRAAAAADALSRGQSQSAGGPRSTFFDLTGVNEEGVEEAHEEVSSDDPKRRGTGPQLSRSATAQSAVVAPGATPAGAAMASPPSLSRQPSGTAVVAAEGREGGQVGLPPLRSPASGGVTLPPISPGARGLAAGGGGAPSKISASTDVRDALRALRAAALSEYAVAAA